MYIPMYLGIYAVIVLIATVSMQLYSLTRSMPDNEAEYHQIRRTLNTLANVGVVMLFSVPIIVVVLWVAGMFM